MPTRETKTKRKIDEEKEKEEWRAAKRHKKVKGIAIRNAGKGYREIAVETGDGKSEAQNIFKVWEDEKRIDDKPRSGRSEKLSQESKVGTREEDVDVAVGTHPLRFAFRTSCWKKQRRTRIRR